MTWRGCSATASAPWPARLIPSDLAEDWAIITAYMHEAADSIEEWLASGEPRTQRSGLAVTPDLMTNISIPRVVHWDALAGLTTQDGTRRLKNACVAVKQYFDAEVPRSLEPSELLMLERLASGAADRGRGIRDGLLGALDVPGNWPSSGTSSECRAERPGCTRRPLRA